MTEIEGKTLSGRYRVEKMIGRGGMAEVYKVWDNKRATYLALKLMKEEMALDPVFLRRFTREANTLAKLQHPNIVTFYGLEQDEFNSFLSHGLGIREILRFFCKLKVLSYQYW